MSASSATLGIDESNFKAIGHASPGFSAGETAENSAQQTVKDKRIQNDSDFVKCPEKEKKHSRNC